MPKLYKSVPKYGKHKPTNRARVVINGQYHYLGVYGSPESKAEYDKLISQWLSAGRRPEPVYTASRDNLTIIELIAAYWKHASKYYRKNGEATSELSFIKLALKDLKRLYGKELAAEFGPLKLKALREHRIRQGHVRKTINDQTGRIKRVFKWATSEELVGPSIYHALQAVAGLSSASWLARRRDLPKKPRGVSDLSSGVQKVPNRSRVP